MNDGIQELGREPVTKQKHRTETKPQQAFETWNSSKVCHYVFVKDCWEDKHMAMKKKIEDSILKATEDSESINAADAQKHSIWELWLNQKIILIVKSHEYLPKSSDRKSAQKICYTVIRNTTFSLPTTLNTCVNRLTTLRIQDIVNDRNPGFGFAKTMILVILSLQ